MNHPNTIGLYKFMDTSSSHNYFLRSVEKISEKNFLETLVGKDKDLNKSWYQQWAEGRSSHLCRIFNIINGVPNSSGPILDIGSEGGCFYKPFKQYRPDLLPYHITDLGAKDEIEIDGDKVKSFNFECDKDILPFDPQTLGLVLLCDVIEHLIVDPVWTILEINRVLKLNGHFVVSTPNVASMQRIGLILNGLNPCTDNHYTPTFIGGRHNREWSPFELVSCITDLGFELAAFSTNQEILTEYEKQFLAALRSAGIIKLGDEHFGPDTVVIFKKTSHLTLSSNIDKDKRWPIYLYSSADCYRQRPSIFPVNVGKDPTIWT